MSPTNWNRLNQHLARRLLLGVGICFLASQGFCTPKIYDDVSEDRVLAIWQFKPGAELKDGKGVADLSLKGSSQIVPDKVFGGALECFATPKDENKPNGAATDSSVVPTPPAAFTLEAWVKLKAQPENPDWSTGYIIDKMYIPYTHADTTYNKEYFFCVNQKQRGETVVLQAGVGLGTEVITFSSDPIPYAPDVWRHMAFVYNGRGTGMLFVDDQRVGMKHYDGKGAAVPNEYGVSIGERVGSSYCGLPGFLAQVRISQGVPTAAVFLDVAIRHPFQRTAFERMEQNQSLQLTLNTTAPGSAQQAIHSVVLKLDDGVSTRQFSLGDLNDKSRIVTFPLPCTRKAGAYALKITATGRTQDNQLITGEGHFSYNLCNRLPEFMPVVMWGNASSEQMKKIGFTHSLYWMDHQDAEVWAAGKSFGFNSAFDAARSDMDEKLVQGLRVMGKISPGEYLNNQKDYEAARQPFMCQDSEGQPGKQVDFALPRVQQFGFDVGRTLANNLSMFPALDIVIPDSEIRDYTELSFRNEDRAAFKAFSGYDFPEAVSTATSRGLKYGQIDGFPQNRIIADDNEILTFFRWFWGEGDGLPGFLTQEWKGLTAEGSRIRVLWDPAVRCPSKWGSGGHVNWISHWTYVYPDPLVMGLATDELFAMVKGGPPHQQVAKMTQLIWYRSGTTGPLPEDKSKWTEWEKRLPDTQFITIPPDMLEIAFWQKVSRPVRSIMYHGSGSLWDKGEAGGYDFTNPETAPRLVGLIEGVVKPLGPTLLQVPNRPAKVAMLESFASQMFYGDSTYAMSGPVARMHAVLERAHLQPEIIYDETILRDGLDQYRVLVMPSCAVLPESVFRSIRQWQVKGGIIVADTQLAPALAPDVLIRQLENDKKEDSIAVAKHLRDELAEAYLPYADADTPEAILRVRSFGTTDYLFALNDHRMFGDYVGQYGKVMEKGVPTSAELTVRRPAGTVYDLLQSKVVKAEIREGSLRISAEFGPGQGRLFMIVERPIAGLTVTGPDAVRRSNTAEFSVAVTDDAKQLIDAVIPVRVDITDAQGALAEYSGWYAAVSGALKLKLNIAPNDAVGVWTVKVRDLASGRTAQMTFNVE